VSDPISEQVYAEHERFVREHAERVVPTPNDPMAVARTFVAEYYTGADGVLLLRHHRGGFYGWSGTCWPEAEEGGIRADLYRWLERASYLKKTKDGDMLVPFEPTRHKIANLVEALEAIGHLEASVSAPAWLGQEWSGEIDPIIAGEFVPMANGLLHLPSRELVPHTPAFFSHYALPFDFDPGAPKPARWWQFLGELWEDDDESTDALAELFGYILGGATAQQKIFMVVGPKRSGKGTIGRVLTGLLSVHHTAAPTLAGLTTNFGLSPLIGKPLAVISDARLGARVDGMVAVERLLSISGEDSLTIDRKYLAPWTGRLPTRFLILTNELPRFTDNSGALASRFVLLTLIKSFYGREDPTLTDQLLAEAPGIFNWALEGLDRLTERGYFVQPESAREALRHIEDLSAPVGAFVRDFCEVGPAFEVDKDELYQAWKDWCQLEGRKRPGSKAVFTRDLRAAVPGVTPRRLREGETRWHVFQGLKLIPQWRTSLTSRDQAGSSAGGQGGSGVVSIVDPHRGKAG
jgi:putative DNA primase/helicase